MTEYRVSIRLGTGVEAQDEDEARRLGAEQLKEIGLRNVKDVDLFDVRKPYTRP